MSMRRLAAALALALAFWALPVRGAGDQQAHALVDVRIVTSPGNVIESGTVVLRDGIIGRFWGTGIFARLANVRSQLRQQRVDLPVIEADAIEGAIALQLFEHAGKAGVIPLGEFGCSVEGDPECGGLRIVEVELDDVALLPLQLAHGRETTVAADDEARAPAHDQGLYLAETLEAGSNSLHVRVPVKPHISGI